MAAELQVTLITGRTMKQGIGLVLGKESDEYKKEVSVVEISKEDMEKLNIQEGNQVILSTDTANGEFTSRVSELPEGLVFVPFGPPVNALIGWSTNGTGMPDSKGMTIKIRKP